MVALFVGSAIAGESYLAAAEPPAETIAQRFGVNPGDYHFLHACGVKEGLLKKEGREFDDKDWKRITALAEKDSEIGSMAFSEGFVQLSASVHRAEIIKIAIRHAHSSDPGRAYTAIALLQCWKCPVWRGLALERDGEWPDPLNQLVAEAKETK